jgi:2'-5' RNA ligase
MQSPQKMKIFAVYLRINLINKPQWFDDFRARNDGWFPLHITLIQPRLIEEYRIDQLKSEVQDYLKTITFTENQRKLIFNKPVFDESEGKYLFMWFSKENIKLKKFQSGLLDLLKNYSQYMDPVTKTYETKFEPHITIAENISSEEKNHAETLLRQNSQCEGVILDLAVPVVIDTSKEERENEKNIKYYKLLPA